MAEETQRFAEDLPSFDFGLLPQGDHAADFRTENPPGMDELDPETREDIISRRGRVEISCECKGVVHEKARESGGPYHSLVVLEFRFEPNGLARRIKEAHVAVKFAATKDKTDPRADPEVVGIAPDGFFCVAPTTQKETSSKEVGGSVGGGAAGGKAELTFKLQQAIEGETWDATTVKGRTEKRGRNWGPKNCASFSFFENPSRRNGVVSSMTVAILVKRRDMSIFRASVTIKTEADTFAKLLSVFSRAPKDDDVFFNPVKSPKGGISGDVSDLSGFPLDSVARVTFRTFLLDVIKEKAQGGQ